MAVQIVGVSLQPEVLAQLDGLAASEGLGRSGMVARLVQAELERRRLARGRVEALDVVVGGVRYVPARARRSG